MISFLSRICSCTAAMTAGSEILQTRCTTPYSSVISMSGVRRPPIEQCVDFARAAVEHEELAKVGAGCAQQVQAVGLGLG